MTQSDNFDKEFRDTYFALLKAVGDPDFDKMTRTELRWKVGQMMRDNKVSRMTFVSAIIEGQRLYPDKFDYIVGGLLKNVVARVADRDLNGAFPELLWLLHASGHLSDRNTMTDMFDLAQDLIIIAGHQLARSYLNYLLLSSPSDEAKIIIPAYYYTGHDIESLRLIISLLPKVPDMNATIYTDAMVFVHRLQGEELPPKDVEFLTEFLSTGLTHNSSIIVGYCQKALEELKKFGDSKE